MVNFKFTDSKGTVFDGTGRALPVGALTYTQPKTVYGCSGGANQAASIALLHPKLLRTYTAGQQAAAPRTQPQCYSAKPDLAALAGRVSATITSTVATFTALSDIPGHYVCIGHETDNDLGADPVVYQAAWRTFLSDVIPRVNAARNNKVRTVAIDTGSADHAKWNVPGADVIGCDPYSTKAVQTFVAFAKSQGRPYGIAEWGYSAQGIVATDDQFAARVATDSQAWAGAEFVLLYNSRANSLVDNPRPKTTAAWLALTGK